MALILNYATVPPARARIGQAKTIRKDVLKQMVNMQHNLFSYAGESCHGVMYVGDTTPLTTTLTTYTFSSLTGWGLERYLPYLEFDFRIVGNDSMTLTWRAFVRNLSVKVEVLDESYSVTASSTRNASNNTPQWIGRTFAVSGLIANPGRVLQVTIARLAYADDGTLYHFSAKNDIATASNIPT